jgi:DNA-binding transcriptional LysR family regulator
MGNDWAEFSLLAKVLMVLKHGSFRVAAEQEHITQSCLSRATKIFHDQSGMRLYELGKDKRVLLNRVGAAFRAMIPLLFQLRDEIFAALRAIASGGIRKLRLGCETVVDPGLFQMACEIHKRYLPDCVIDPFSEDAEELVKEVRSGEIDGALVTLPLDLRELSVETIRHDPLVICLRTDDPLAAKAAVHPVDLKGKRAILPHPQQHRAAYARLLELFAEIGVQFDECSRASHPSGMQQLVLDGFGLALIREGTALYSGLTTRPITGAQWTVDTVFIYHNEHHPETIPPLAKHLKLQVSTKAKSPAKIPVETIVLPSLKTRPKHAVQHDGNGAQQLSLLDQVSQSTPAGLE